MCFIYALKKPSIILPQGRASERASISILITINIILNFRSGAERKFFKSIYFQRTIAHIHPHTLPRGKAKINSVDGSTVRIAARVLPCSARSEGKRRLCGNNNTRNFPSTNIIVKDAVTDTHTRTHTQLIRARWRCVPNDAYRRSTAALLTSIDAVEENVALCLYRRERRMVDGAAASNLNCPMSLNVNKRSNALRNGVISVVAFAFFIIFVYAVYSLRVESVLKVQQLAL